jgi:hypothetical protein
VHLIYLLVAFQLQKNQPLLLVVCFQQLIDVDVDTSYH